MDDAHTPREIIAAEYRFLHKFNRWTDAGKSLLAAIDARVRPVNGVVQVVDFGSGGGDIPRHLASLAASRPWRLQCTCTDASADAVAYARSLPPVEGLTFAVVDMLRAHEELGERTADVVHSSLVMHHQSDENVVRALRSTGLVARQLVVWNDLVREQAGVWGARLCTLFAGPELRHDAIVSVRRSFTLAEARMLAEAAGLRDIQVKRVCGARFVLTARPDVEATAELARPLVRVESISFAYGAQHVFANVSFVARSRQMVRVTGANGSGKSTLLACVAGALQPAAGTAWVDRTQTPPGYLPQEGGLFAALDGRANLELAASLSGIRPQDRSARIRETAQLLGLESHLRVPVHQLSGGQRRRVAIACSIVHDPNVLIVDEPDAGLDGVGRMALATVIARVIAKGGTVLAASHTRDWSEGVPGIERVVEVAL